MFGVAVCLIASGSATAATACDLYASPSGSRGANGHLRRPFGSIAALDNALRPGETGCVEAGTYGKTSPSGWTDLANSGAPGDPIKITPVPGERPKIVGLVIISGSYTTLSGFHIDGSNTAYDKQRPGTDCAYPVSAGLEIDGQNDIFQHNDLYQSIAALRGNGIGIGWNGQADGTVIRFNRIHDVGQCMAFDQIIYLAHGNDVQIYDNWMWNDPHGWAVQVYPAATHAHIYDNVIDNVGSGFVIGGSSGVSGNRIDHNIVLNSSGLVNAGLPRGVGISTCCGLGRGNSFTDNDVYDNPGGIAAASGITLADNTTNAPQLADPGSQDFRLTPASPSALAGWSLWDGGLGSSAQMASRKRHDKRVGAHAHARTRRRRGHHHRRRRLRVAPG